MVPLRVTHITGWAAVWLLALTGAWGQDTPAEDLSSLKPASSGLIRTLSGQWVAFSSEGEDSDPLPEKINLAEDGTAVFYDAAAGLPRGYTHAVVFEGLSKVFLEKPVPGNASAVELFEVKVNDKWSTNGGLELYNTLILVDRTDSTRRLRYHRLPSPVRSSFKDILPARIKWSSLSLNEARCSMYLSTVKGAKELPGYSAAIVSNAWAARLYRTMWGDAPSSMLERQKQANRALVISRDPQSLPSTVLPVAVPLGDQENLKKVYEVLKQTYAWVKSQVALGANKSSTPEAFDDFKIHGWVEQKGAAAGIDITSSFGLPSGEWQATFYVDDVPRLLNIFQQYCTSFDADDVQDAKAALTKFVTALKAGNNARCVALSTGSLKEKLEAGELAQVDLGQKQFEIGTGEESAGGSVQYSLTAGEEAYQAHVVPTDGVWKVTSFDKPASGSK